MFYCARCGIRFSAGALSGETDCPRCKARDGVDQPLRADRLRPIERLGAWRPDARQAPGNPARPERHLYSERR
jgi:hypothetical protein